MSKIVKIDFAKINQNPIGFITSNQVSEKTLQKILEKASTSYYETSAELLSDSSFDKLKDHLEENYPDNPFLKQIGADVQGPNKVKLPIHMGSMDKKKKDKDISGWIKKYPGEVVISDKLDGISFLLVIKNGTQQLLTRGNGTYGKDISQIIPFLRLPKQPKLDAGEEIIIRGEMLVSQQNFQKVKDKFSNGRSFIAGLSNFKELTADRKKYLKLVDLVCYELVKPNLKTNLQLSTLIKMGYQVVPHKIEKSINYPLLQEYLLERKDKSIYDIDGIIITKNQVNLRITSGNPKYSFAFKMDLEFAITTVKFVEWNASKHGKLKPTVYIEPVHLNGSLNSKATGNNADFIEKNKIGPGAKVKIIKGGEIIPKIEEVLKGTKAQFPEVEYKWNATHKEILLVNLDNQDMQVKKLVSFFKVLEVDNLGIGLLTKLHQNGYNTIKKICLITPEQLMELDGIKEKSASKIHNNIQKVITQSIPLEKIVAGSCILGDGIGQKILVKIFQYFQIKKLEDLGKITLPGLVGIEGIEEKTASKILQGVPKIQLFMKEHPFLKFIPYSSSSQQKKNGLLQGKNIVLTGKRDADIIKFIEKEGGEIKSAVNKNTDMLVVDSLELTTSKMTKAKQLNVTILTTDKFKNQFL